MKRWLLGVLSAAMLLFLSLTAEAAITSCALDGLYVASSAVDQHSVGMDQVQALFTFTPPTTCSNGASGTVNISGTLLQLDNSSPFPISVTGAPYVVDEIGHLTIVFSNVIIIDGQIGLLADTTAHSFVFVAGESGVPSIRFSGVAVKQTLASGPPGPIGPTGPQGPQGPTGATGATGARPHGAARRHRSHGPHRPHRCGWRDGGDGPRRILGKSTLRRTVPLPTARTNICTAQHRLLPYSHAVRYRSAAQARLSHRRPAIYLIQGFLLSAPARLPLDGRDNSATRRQFDSVEGVGRTRRLFG